MPGWTMLNAISICIGKKKIQKSQARETFGAKVINIISGTE